MTHDVIVVGSGAAGLTAALALAETRKVLVLAKGGLNEGSTAWAQGGIAAVLDEGDTFDNHVRDTMVALEARLDPTRFARVHRSAIVNVSRVREVKPHGDRDYLAVLRDGTRLKVSRTYRHRLPS